MTSYPLFKAHIKTPEAIEQISKVLESGFINEGEQVTQLTSFFQDRYKTKNIVLVNSCTSAIQMALELSGVKRFDDVLSTPMTCVATNCPIQNLQADVIWCDIDPMTGCIDPITVEAEILREFNTTSLPKALIVVAWAGNPPDLKALRMICDRYKMKLILDAAHAFDAMYDGENISLIPDFTCYSFQAIKHFTTGDGGMLVCKNVDDYVNAKKIKWFGIDRDDAKDEKGNWKGQHWDFDVEKAGHKFNMNNLSAALGLSQIPFIDDVIATHRKNANLYSDLMKDSVYVKPLTTPDNSLSSYWVYTILLNDEFKDKRDELLKRLNAVGIAAGLVHVPNDSYTTFRTSKRILPGVRSFSQRQLSLPVGWWLSSGDIEHIAKQFNEICEEVYQ